MMAKSGVRLESLRGLRELSESLREAGEFPDLLAVLSQKLRRLLDFQRASVALTREDDEATYESYALQDERVVVVGGARPLERSAVGECLSQQQWLVCADLTRSEHIDHRRLAAAGMASSVHVPFRVRAGLLGCINVASATPGAFSDAEAMLVDTAAQILADNLLRLRTSMDHRQSRRAEKRLLESVRAGILRVDSEGRIASGVPEIFESWMTMPSPGTYVWEWLESNHSQVARWFELAWQQYESAALSRVAALDQFPERLEIGGRILRFRYLPEDRVEDGLALLVDEISDSVALERARRDSDEVLTAARQIMHDRSGFVGFVEGADECLRRLVQIGPHQREEQTRQLHTLAGNAAIFGLSSIAASCHRLLDRMGEDSRALDDQELRSLADQWERVSDRLRPMLLQDLERVEVELAEFERVVSSLRERTGHEDIVDRIASWKFEPVQYRLEHFGDQAHMWAERLGKRLVVQVSARGIRHNRALWRRFWAEFTHVVRNAVDHGLEEPSARAEAAKSEVGSLYLRARVETARFVLEIEDDGRGVDWQRLRAKAGEIGLSNAPEDVADEQLLFTSGVSSRDVATESSGRGVGMASLRAVVEDMGGVCSVHSESGRGTRFRFEFPADRLLMAARRVRAA